VEILNYKYNNNKKDYKSLGRFNGNLKNIQNKIREYFAVNGFVLNHNRELINSICQQTKNGLDVIVIPLSFFKYDKQLWIWISESSDKTIENNLKLILVELFGKCLCNHKIKVMKNR
jgi:hypothetical protein